MLEKLFPKIENPIQNARAQLVMQTSIGIALIIFLLLAYWVVFSVLEQIETVYAGIFVIAILAGNAALTLSGRVRVGSWILILFLVFVVLEVSIEYGIETMSMAGFLLPIVMAAILLGFWAGMGIATLGVAVVWAVGFAAATGSLQTAIPYQESVLTFTAPTLTFLYLLIAALVGSWSDRITRLAAV